MPSPLNRHNPNGLAWGNLGWPKVGEFEVAIGAKSIEPDGSESLCLGQVTNYAYRPSDVVKNDKVFQLVTFERFDRLVAAAAQC